MITLEDTLEELGELKACKQIALRMEISEMVAAADPIDRAIIREELGSLLAAEDED